MKIQSVSFLNQTKNSVKKNSLNKQKAEINNVNPAKLPSTSQFLAFCRGYTLNLRETYKHLKSEDYPQDIQKQVEVALQNDETNKTLYNVHFDKYAGVLDCYTLDDLKEKYPEFQDVLSVYDVQAKDESFIGSYLNNKNDVFSQEEDLTLQLIKLYWGQGFSLNDLSKYVAENSKSEKGINLYHTMAKKLNIPLMSPQYASVLKLSNKEYNERFTSEMSLKRKEANEAKKQREEGEPVIIPEGLKSPQHKRHINENLERHFKRSPEDIYKMSQRQKKFYEENPEFLERMSLAMDYAWNVTQEGRSVKKHLSKFMKKHSITDEQLALKKEISQEQRCLLQQFWDKNPWAKEKFSTATKLGWENAFIEHTFDGQSINKEKITYNIMPVGMKNKICAWAKKKNKELPDVPIGRAVVYINQSEIAANHKTKKAIRQAEAITEQYFKENPLDSDILASTIQYTLTEMYCDLTTNSPNLPNSIRQDVMKRNVSYLFFDACDEKFGKLFTRENGYIRPIPGITNSQITNYLSMLMYYYCANETCELAEYFNKNLEKSYQNLLNGTIFSSLKVK